MKRRAPILLALLAAVAALALDWREVAGVRIPEGEAVSVAVDGETVWKRVPYDAEVEYVEATGSQSGFQYIDTQIPVSPSIRIEAAWSQTGISIQQRLFGVNDGSGKTFACYINNDGKWAVNTGTSSGGAMQTVTRIGYVGTFDLATGSCTINGTTRANGGVPFSSANTIPIFARRNSGTVATNYPAQMRLSYFRIYDGSSLVRDYIPVRNGTEGALFDKVSGRVFKSATATPLLPGLDK